MHLGAEAHIVRVPTDDNIADLPSRPIPRGGAIQPCMDKPFRQSYKLLKQLGMRVTAAHLDPVYLQAQTWEQLSLKLGCCPVAAKPPADVIPPAEA